MRKDFKKAGYFLAVLIFFFGICALVISSIASYFLYSKFVVIIGQSVAFIALIALIVICIFAKNNYNYVCTMFADYIIDNRKKEAKYQENEAEHIKQIENIKSAAKNELDNAVAAALEQGRNEGAHAALQAVGSKKPIPPNIDNTSKSSSMPQIEAAQPVMPQPQPRPMPTYAQPVTPNDEILYNQYGEPVMIRRRVRKNPEHYDADMLYDRFGNPVERCAQNIWEISGQHIKLQSSYDDVPTNTTTHTPTVGDASTQESENSQQ